MEVPPKQLPIEVLASESIYDSRSSQAYRGYVAIQGDTIVDVGKGPIPSHYIVEGATLGDYGRGTITAGLGDTHTFFPGYAIDNLGADLSCVSSLAALEEAVRSEIGAKPERRAVFGNHLDRRLLGSAATELLDDLGRSTGLPIVMFVAGHDTCAMNDLARQEFDFTPERCHAEALIEVMGVFLTDREFIDGQFQEYMTMLNSRGVTSVKEMGFDDYHGFADVLKSFEDNGRLTVRVSFMSQPVARPTDILFGRQMRDLFTSEYVTFAGYNQMTDGLILSREAHLLEPYKGTDTVCAKDIDYASIEREVLDADSNGFRFTLHAEGDGAFRRILDIYEKCARRDGQLLNRHGITDLELTTVGDERRMAQLGVFGEIYAQIYMLDTHDAYVGGLRAQIGDRQAQYLNYRSLIDSGVKLCGATDLPLLLPSLPESIYHGCANYGADAAAQINPENAMTIAEMVDAWTINSQYAMGREGVLGSLEIGKKADIVIYDADLFATPMDTILRVSVRRTLVGGREVFNSERGVANV